MPDPKPEQVERYHVFLASPGDVDDERQAVRDFFTEYNRTTASHWGVEFTVIDWENYSTIGLGRPQELITQQTLHNHKDSLALVIGLMAQRFGSPTGTHESGTEEEFEWALEHHRRTGWPEIKWFFRKIDRFSAPSDPTKIKEAAEQWDKVRAFKKKLQAPGPHQSLYAHFTDLAHFKDVLRNDLSTWLADPARPWTPDATATPAPGIPIPTAAHSLHQLPAPPRDFTGRKAEIEELLAKISEGGVTISGLRGLGGIGKTALALVLADRLKPDYPDAQFFINLRGTDPNPMTAADAMARVIHGYHPEQRVPDNEAELRAAYNSVLHNQRALLLMDNAAEAAQIEPLIPPESCLLLVTSRQHFTIPGLYAKDLDTLPPEDARDLLLTIAPRIGGQADQIANLCGHLPLALRLAGSALAARPDLSPAEYVQRLTNEQKRLRTLDKLATDSSQGIEASISLSESLLSDDQRDRWHALAVFPADFNVPGAAVVWALDADPASDALSDIVGYSLVEFNEETGRHRLHDLVRLYTDQRLIDQPRTNAQQRHASHYCGVAGLANETYLNGRDDVVRGLAIFDLERTNFESGFAWSQENVEANEIAARLCSAYPDAAAHCLALSLHPQDQIAWREPGLRAARRLKDRQAEGNHLGNLGLAHQALGNPRRAIECYEQHLTIARELGDRAGEANGLGNMGLGYADLGEQRRAIAYYEQQVTIASEIGDRRGKGAALGNMGNAYAALGEPRRATECCEQHLTIAREIGDRSGEGNALGGLGSAYTALGEPQRAIEYYE